MFDFVLREIMFGAMRECFFEIYFFQGGIVSLFTIFSLWRFAKTSFLCGFNAFLIFIMATSVRFFIIIRYMSHNIFRFV